MVRPQVQQFPVSLPAGAKTGARLANGQLELVFTGSTQTYDGRFANNAWLQEIPDFVTRSVWDNYAMVSPATAPGQAGRPANLLPSPGPPPGPRFR